MEEKSTGGKIKYINVFGNGQNSAYLQFDLVGWEDGPFLVLAYPAHEPQVFSAMASLLSAAYIKDSSVDVTYFTNKLSQNIATGITIKG